MGSIGHSPAPTIAARATLDTILLLPMKSKKQAMIRIMPSPSLSVERLSTALRPCPAAYRFNLLRLLAGRLRVRRVRDAVSLTLRASNSFTSRFPTLRNATRVMRFLPVGIESPAAQWATAVALTPTRRARAVWLRLRRRRKLSMSRGESRAAFASSSDTCGIAGEASMSRFQPFALRRRVVTVAWRFVTFFRSRTTSRRSGVTTTRTCLRAPRAIASLITVSSFANERLLVKVRQRSNHRRSEVTIILSDQQTGPVLKRIRRALTEAHPTTIPSVGIPPSV